jgi:aminopeptidase
MSIHEQVKNWAMSGKDEWQLTKQQIKDITISPSLPFAEFLSSVQQLILDSLWYEGFLATNHRSFKDATLSDLLDGQSKFYSDLMLSGESADSIPYSKCPGNPEYAVSLYGREMGQLLSAIYMRFRFLPQWFIQNRYSDLALSNRLFIQLHALALENKTDYRLWLEAYKHTLETYIGEQQLFALYWRFCPEQSYYRDIVMQSDLADVRYLFQYGVYIDEHVLRMARFMNSYPESELKSLSQYIVQSYKDGFERGHRSYQIKQYAVLIIPAGMERLGRMLISDLQAIGLTAIVSQPQTQSFNKQYDYDHRFDIALNYDRQYIDKMLPAYEQAVNQMSAILKLQAGPVYVELFGETPFNPANKEAALKLNDEQLNLRRTTSSQTTQMFYKHYIQEETSFCIIAFPSTEIGSKFEPIFADTVKINLLDSIRYGDIQQKIIDVLDTAEYVHIKGKAGNMTDIMVRLHPLANPDHETNFENCVADVNIPVGEVFTSPLLTGTNGVLHVEDIYLRNLRYYNLKVTFTDGMITDYDCTNFNEAEANRKYIEENLLMPHKTLPIGEFAIGTNTTAYQIAKKYDILALLPILIIEKMGPHFAIGDTCYTREEDVDHFNFVNGKKLIAVDNEKTALRHSDPMNAYTQVHTDITLPYEMLESISAVKADGSRIDIIRDGFFTVPGTEELNIPLREMNV